MEQKKKKNSREMYIRAQRYLIASLMVRGEEIPKVLDLISEEDVDEPALSLVFSAMAELYRRNEPVSIISVGEELQRRGELENAGELVFLHDLYTEGEQRVLEAPVQIYARLVKESSAKFKIKKLLVESVPNFNDDSGVQANDAVSNIQSYLNDELLKLSDSSTITEFNDFESYIEILNERERISKDNAENAEGLQGIPCLLPSLNDYTTGWLPGQLITVGAGTGIGKSVFAVNCAIASAMANKTTMFFSLEMGSSEISDRIISATTSIPLKKLKRGTLSDDEKTLLNDQMKSMKNMKIIIDVEPRQTVDSIRARALKQAQSPDGLDFIIVDYLQLITATGNYSTRQEAVADISRNMKLLAKKLDIPIMVLVQMRRNNNAEEEDLLPKLDNIRESGAIAQDSDIVILLHREKSTDNTIPHTLVLLEKNRNGEVNRTIRCHSNLECSLFREVVRVKDLSPDGIDDFDTDTEDFNTDMDLTAIDEGMEEIDSILMNNL